MQIQYSFSPNELIDNFRLIGETFKLGSNKVNTGRGKRLYESCIVSKGYDEDAVELINKAKYAHSHGLRNDIQLTAKQIVVMNALVKYCMEL